MNRIAIAFVCVLAANSVCAQVTQPCNCCPADAGADSTGVQLPVLGHVTGTVALDTGMLPGATVTLENVKNHFTQYADANGRFEFLNVPPGEYRLRAELEGLKPWRKKRVKVSAGATAYFEVRMRVDESLSACVDCGEAAMPLPPDGPSFVITREMIDKLPLP